MMSMMMGGSAGAAAGATEEVFYIKTEGQQYKSLPIKMTVLVDQAKLPDFLVGLENSPMTIQVMEVEIAKPLAAVVKPVYGERSGFNMGMGSSMMGMRGGEESSGNAMMMRNMGGRGMMGGMAPGARGGSGPGDSSRAMMEMMGRGMGGTGKAAAPKKGNSIRDINKAQIRKEQNKDASKAKAETKNKVDQYFNIIEVTVYGQARFYLAPPTPPATPPSTAAAPPAATPEPPKAEAPKAEVPKAEAPKAEEPAKKVEEPKKDESPKAETPKATAPAPTPTPAEPKTESPKPEAPKAAAPPTEAPKSDAPAPKR